MIMTSKTHRNNHGFDLKTTTTLILIVFLIGFGSTTMYYAFYKVTYMKIYDVKVETTPGRTLGFNVDPNLHFGRIPMTGGISEKELNLNNDDRFPVKVEIRISGNAAKFIIVEENDFILRPGELRKLKVKAVIPDMFNEANVYLGEAKIIFFRT